MLRAPCKWRRAKLNITAGAGGKSDIASRRAKSMTKVGEGNLILIRGGVNQISSIKDF